VPADGPWVNLAYIESPGKEKWRRPENVEGHAKGKENFVETRQKKARGPQHSQKEAKEGEPATRIVGPVGGGGGVKNPGQVELEKKS